ncbi:hypothetical protein EJ110_NYTH42867 [Nymphaea thermarum]|nr:hypothetical protein EJ110_NYTH42867 [Nymphaea thermarum]
MAPHRRNPQCSTIDGRVQRTSLETDVDDGYWRFLEEIDAPMWVDLEAEAQLMVQDSHSFETRLNPIIIQFPLDFVHCSDDAWFYTVHPFHQSSHHFISSFPLLDKDNQERPNMSSPHLPGSVSGSRGKHYKKQSWAEATGITSRFQKSPQESDLFQHPIKLLGGKKSLSSISSNDHSTSKGEFTTKTPGKASKISSGSTKITVSSCRDIADKSCPRPAISRASRPFSSGSGLLSAVKICLRKSYVTGHASRVEIKDVRHLRDQKTSSSSKSSIESSTITGGTSGSGGLGTSRKERTPQSRMASTRTTTVRSGNGFKRSSKYTAMARAQVPERKPNSKMKTCATGTPKALRTTTSKKPLRPLNSTAAPKLKAATKPTQSMSTLKIQKTTSTKIAKENATKFSEQSRKGAVCSAKLKDGKGAPLVKVILQSPAPVFLFYVTFCSTYLKDASLENTLFIVDLICVKLSTPMSKLCHNLHSKPR